MDILSCELFKLNVFDFLLRCFTISIYNVGFSLKVINIVNHLAKDFIYFCIVHIITKAIITRFYFVFIGFDKICLF